MEWKVAVTIDEARRNQKTSLKLANCNLKGFSSANMMKVCNSSILRLFLQNNELQDLPEDFGLSGLKLQFLSLAYNKLTRLPITFGEMDLLTRLNISHNDFSVEGFPFVLCKLQNLRVLWANGIGIDELPKDFENLTELKLLGLRNNLFTHFPSSILNLPKLQWLTLSRNSIQVIPSELDQMKTLVHLNLSSNQISVLPNLSWDRMQVKQNNIIM
jgi:Leucine-rich repeat (LRR) protein